VICNLFDDLNHGIFHYIDQSSSSQPKITDRVPIILIYSKYYRFYFFQILQMILESFDQNLSGCIHYNSRQIQKSEEAIQPDYQFRISHFFGDVIYDIDGFMEKSSDKNVRSIIDAFRNRYRQIIDKSFCVKK